MSIEVANESGAEVDEKRIVELLARFVLDHMRVHPQAELSPAGGRDAMEQLHVQWMDEPGPDRRDGVPDGRAAPGYVTTTEPAPGLLGDIVLCPSVAERAGRAGRALHRRTSSTCCARTGSCTCSAMTTPSPTSKAEMFGLQASCSRPGARKAAGPMTSTDVWLLVAAAVLVLVAALLRGADAALSRCRGRASRSSPRRPPRRETLARLVADPALSVNAVLLMRTLCETGAASWSR